LDNGLEPFKVDITGKDVKIYKLNMYKFRKDIYDEYNKTSLLTYKNVKKIFIGKHNLNTSVSYKKFDGNSILLHLKEDEYIFIGWIIYRFKSFLKITKYISDVGNSCVTYPYAVDTNNNYYLMRENVILQNMKTMKDPYDYYYDRMDEQYLKMKKKILQHRL
jgi:hypothetical protein